MATRAIKIRRRSSSIALHVVYEHAPHLVLVAAILVSPLLKAAAFSGHQASVIGPSQGFKLPSQHHTCAGTPRERLPYVYTTTLSKLLSTTPQRAAAENDSNPASSATTDKPTDTATGSSRSIIVDGGAAESLCSVEQATKVLTAFDRAGTDAKEAQLALQKDSFSTTSLTSAVYTLNAAAQREREDDTSRGRCMLGICAGSAPEGLTTLKAWVTTLHLPRGLLHGMDLDGQPLDLEGSAVYIKYNSGGVTSFAEIRKRGLDAVWKPGDAMLEEYDGPYRGVYFQVELADDEFRQFFLPLDLFCIDGAPDES